MALCDHHSANGKVGPKQRKQSLKLFSGYSELVKTAWMYFFQEQIAINKINLEKEKKNIYTRSH